MYILVWEFQVRADAAAAFEALYGPAGAWVALFRRADGYIGTELLRSTLDPRRYLSVDRWSSRAAYESFRERWRGEYEALDGVGEGLTESERFVGEFARLPSD